MRYQLAAWTQQELEEAAVAAATVNRYAKQAGQYHLAAMARSFASMLNITLICRIEDARDHAERQLSLVPPGTYDEPA